MKCKRCNTPIVLGELCDICEKHLARIIESVKKVFCSNHPRPEIIKFFVGLLRGHCLAPGKAQPPNSCGCTVCFSAKLLETYSIQTIMDIPESKRDAFGE